MISMETGEILVYASGSTHYIGCFDGTFYRWEARADGWRARTKASEHDVDPNRELEPRLARLALKLSHVGVLP